VARRIDAEHCLQARSPTSVSRGLPGDVGAAGA
jgi:hypothetical protein